VGGLPVIASYIALLLEEPITCQHLCFYKKIFLFILKNESNKMFHSGISDTKK
jgi:hypothetical protein